MFASLRFLFFRPTTTIVSTSPPASAHRTSAAQSATLAHADISPPLSDNNIVTAFVVCTPADPFSSSFSEFTRSRQQQLSPMPALQHLSKDGPSLNLHRSHSLSWLNTSPLLATANFQKFVTQLSPRGRCRHTSSRSIHGISPLSPLLYALSSSPFHQFLRIRSLIQHSRHCLSENDHSFNVCFTATASTPLNHIDLFDQANTSDNLSDNTSPALRPTFPAVSAQAAPSATTRPPRHFLR
jgi:hypothetical protein